MHIIKTEQKKKSAFTDFISHLFKNHLFESAATLSYYFLFSVFPLIIFISSAFSTFSISSEKLEYLGRIVPKQILTLFQNYLDEISSENTRSLMVVGIVLTIYSMGKALQTLKRKVRLAYQIQPKLSWVREWIVTLIFVLLIMLSIYATLILIVAGDYIINNILFKFLMFSEFSGAIHFFRYTAVTAYLAFVLFGLYYVLPGFKLRGRYVFPGTMFALSAWILMSWIFSVYFTHFANYSTLYGSLGTIIALLSWLFLINTVVLLGVHINSYIYMKTTGHRK